MLQHVTLEVEPSLLPRCVAFWELLGFGEVDPPASLAGRARWMERLGTQVHLMGVDKPVAMPRGHVAVVPPDFEAGMAALEAAGHRCERRAEHWGAARAIVRDPGGHLVELMASPPPPSPSAPD